LEVLGLMYRCPTCVSILSDLTVRRCPVCGENFKRHPPHVIGSAGRLRDAVTSWDVHAQADASKVFSNQRGAPDIDLPKEHERDSSGRTAAVEQG